MLRVPRPERRSKASGSERPVMVAASLPAQLAVREERAICLARRLGSVSRTHPKGTGHAALEGAGT